MYITHNIIHAMPHYVSSSLLVCSIQLIQSLNDNRTYCVFYCIYALQL